MYPWYWPGQKDDKYGMADRMNSAAKYVVASKPLQAQWANTTVVNKDVVAQIGNLKQQPGKDILIQGSGTLVAALAEAGLIDEYKLMVHPAIVDSGKRLFKEGTGMSRLKLVESKPLPSGVMLLTYAPAK